MHLSRTQMQLCSHAKPQKTKEKYSFTHFPLLNTEKLTLWDPGGEKSNMLYGRSMEGSMKSTSYQTLSRYPGSDCPLPHISLTTV